MKKGLVGSMAVLLAGAGWTFAQSRPIPSQPAPLVTVSPAEMPALSVNHADVVGGPEGSCEGGEDSRCSERVWFTAEYLLWWFRDSPVPAPLATTAPATTTALNPGAIGNPDTTVVLGNGDVDTKEHSGARFMAGVWLDGAQTVGFEGGYFFLANHGVSDTVGVNGTPTAPFLTAPFFDVLAGTENSILITAPGIFSGTATLTNAARLEGAEANVTYKALATEDGWRVDLLAGFRWVQLRQELTYATSAVGVAGGLADGIMVNTRDEFDTRNNFYGGQIGVRAEYTLMDRLFVGASAKAALGNVHENVAINGFTQTNVLTGPGGAVQSFPGGIFSQPDNIGVYRRNRLAFIPEVGAKIGYDVTSWCHAFVGYNFLYITNVTQPGNQIDRDINLTRLGINVAGRGITPTGPPAPVFTFHDSAFWAQGIDFGVGLSY